MKVRVKLFGFFAASIIAAVLMMLLAIGFVQEKIHTLSNQVKVEKQASQEAVFLLRSRDMVLFATDYTWWDDMVVAVEEKNVEWLTTNVDHALVSFDTSAIWIYNRSLELVHVTATTQLDQYKALFNQELLSYAHEKKIHSFFIKGPEGLLEVHSATLHRDDDEERKRPGEGILFISRLWSPDFLAELKDISGTECKISGLNLSAHDLDQDQWSTEKLYGWNGMPVATRLIRFESPVMETIIKTSSKLKLGLVCASIIVLLLMIWFLHKAVVAPISKIETALTADSIKDNREMLDRRDEFGAISRLINRSVKDRHVLADEVEKRKQTETELQTALAQKEILIRETHHRVKNNMGIVSSILSLQERTVDSKETSAILKESISRIRAMSVIHERLYQSESQVSIPFSSFIDDIISQFSQLESEGTSIRFDANVLEDEFDLDLLVPIGLIVNEIVTNAIKYAFPDARAGTIYIELRKNDSSSLYELSVRDDGVGFDTNLEHENSFGMKLIRGLAAQIRAELNIDGSNGTEFHLAFSDHQDS